MADFLFDLMQLLLFGIYLLLEFFLVGLNIFCRQLDLINILRVQITIRIPHGISDVVFLDKQYIALLLFVD